MGWFKRTIVDDAKDFETRLRVVKVLLYKKACSYFESQVEDKELAGVYAARVVCYLTGEDLEANTPEATEQAIEEGRKIKDKIPELADGFMKLDKEIRELVIYTLRMRAVIVGYIFSRKSSEFIGSPEYDRLQQVLQKYGAEFPREANPKMYTELVNREMKKDAEGKNQE